MINCPSIEAALRGLAYTNTLPSQPGVYVLERKDDKAVWHVGQSDNLKRRLMANPLNNKNLVRVKVLVCNNRVDVEGWLIKALSPLFKREVGKKFKPREPFNMETYSEAAKILDEIIPTILSPVVRRQAQAVAHKLHHPMGDILAKVPGLSLTDRAKRLKVSRQTMYVWLSEKFRPTRVQAKRIARVTGVPIEHIVDDGFEVDNDTGGKARKKVARVATGRKKAARREAGATPKRRRTVSDRHRVGQA